MQERPLLEFLPLLKPVIHYRVDILQLQTLHIAISILPPELIFFLLRRTIELSESLYREE